MIREAALEYIEGRKYREQAYNLRIRALAEKFERSDSTIKGVLEGKEYDYIDQLEADLIRKCYAECTRCKAEGSKRTAEALSKKHGVRNGLIKQWAEQIQQEQKPSRGSF